MACRESYAIPCSRYVVKEQGLPTPVGPDWQPRSTLLVLLLTDLQHLFNSAGATAFLVTNNVVVSPHQCHSDCFYESVRYSQECRKLLLSEESIQGKKAMSAKSFLLTCAIFCGGYVSNTLLDNALEAAETYFHLQTSTYKTDSNGYIICSTEKPK